MFETLEPPEQIVPRRWLLLMYGIYLLAGLVFLTLGLWRHGVSQPFRLAIHTAMFLLSLTWLATSVRSTSQTTNRQFRVRNMIMILLLMAHDLAQM